MTVSTVTVVDQPAELGDSSSGGFTRVSHESQVMSRSRHVGSSLGCHVGGGDAAVHDERGTGHEARLVGRQEERGLCDLLGLSEPPHRDVDEPPFSPHRDRRAGSRAMASRWDPGRSSSPGSPLRATSTASSLVNASTPPLDAVYATWAVAAPMSATNDATFTIEPPPDDSRAGSPARQHSKTPFRFTRITRSQVSSGVSVTPPSSSGKMPAQLNIT